MVNSKAERQASHRAQKLETMSALDWRAGFDAGKAGQKNQPPQEIADLLAWRSGYIEGKAEKQKAVGGTAFAHPR